MKRVLPLLVIGVGSLVTLYAAAWIVAWAAWKRAGDRPWPMDLGTLEQVPSKFPRREPSADALRLAELARPLGIEFVGENHKDPRHEAIKSFVDDSRESAVAGKFIAQHDQRIDVVRDHLLRSREIAWATDLDTGFQAPLPNLLAHLHVGKLLIARAMMRGAWEDLHAAAILERSMHSRPELVTQLVAIHLARTINTAAAKMPRPMPAWVTEFHAADRRRLILRGAQYDTWLSWRYGADEGGYFNYLTRPYIVASIANLALVQRDTAFELLRITDSEFDAKTFFKKRKEALPRWNVLGRVAIINIAAGWKRVLQFEQAAAAMEDRRAPPAPAR